MSLFSSLYSKKLAKELWVCTLFYVSRDAIYFIQLVKTYEFVKKYSVKVIFKLFSRIHFS